MQTSAGTITRDALRGALLFLDTRSLARVRRVSRQLRAAVNHGLLNVVMHRDTSLTRGTSTLSREDMLHAHAEYKFHSYNTLPDRDPRPLWET